MDELISDRTKFSEIKEYIQVHSLQEENKINNFLEKLKNMSILPDETNKKKFMQLVQALVSFMVYLRLIRLILPVTIKTYFCSIFN